MRVQDSSWVKNYDGVKIVWDGLSVTYWREDRTKANQEAKQTAGCQSTSLDRFSFDILSIRIVWNLLSSSGLKKPMH